MLVWDSVKKKEKHIYMYQFAITHIGRASIATVFESKGEKESNGQ